MSDPYLGQIIMFAGNYAPQGWAMCNGQEVSIAQYTALFAVLGVNYGGNGTTTFALPDLRSRVPVHSGNGTPGPGLSPYPLGGQGGVERQVLTLAELPMHNHTFNPVGANAQILAGDGFGTTQTAAGNILVNSGDPSGSGGGVVGLNFAPQSQAGNLGTLDGVSIKFSGGAIGMTGSSQPVPNLQPYLAVNFIIAIEGLFPPRS